MIHLHPICCGCEEEIGTVQHGDQFYCGGCADFLLDRPEPDEVWSPDPADLARDEHERWMENQP